MTRFKVTERWPDMDKQGYYVGQIIELPLREGGQDYHFIGETKNKYYDAFYEGYPHLFKKLEWFEEISIDQMPEYLKLKQKSFLTAEILEPETIVKVLKHFSCSNGEPNERGCQIFGNDFLAYFKTEPATKEQYEEYKSKQ
jgi:hypothetical protein